MPDTVITTSMRGRPSSSRGIKRRAAQATIGVEARLGADERERLADRRRPRS